MLKRCTTFTILVIINLSFSACFWSHSNQDGPPNSDIDVSNIRSPKPHPLAKSRYGNPNSYVVNGKRYFVLDSADGYVERGIASWYGTKFDGQRTASGEVYDMLALTAASRTLPIPIYAKVTNLDNGRSIIVKVNDRGPFVKNRLIDLSYVAAKKLDYIKTGTAHVEVEAITFDDTTTLAEYYLQVGSFAEKRNALKLQSKLASRIDQPVTIESLNYQGHTRYRVEIGPVAGHRNSARLKHLLQSWGIDTLTRSG